MGRLKLKRLVENWLPPAALSLYREWKGGVSYNGNYSSWQDALTNSTGYDSDLILEKVSSALLKVKSGEAVYERDSVLFNRIEHPFPLLAGLFRAAAANEGKLTVMDFGGSLGSTYFQCRDFLSVLPRLKWCIVEQEGFVRRGRELFETDELSFFFSMQECMEIMKPNAVLFSSVLQYLENPWDKLDEVSESTIPCVIVNRTPFVRSPIDHIVVQRVSPEIFDAKLPCWVLSMERFTETLSKKFDLISVIVNDDTGGQIDEVEFKFMGSIWQRRARSY